MEAEFDIVIDSGLFHVTTDRKAQFSECRYIECENQAANIPCFVTPKEPGDYGPRANFKG